MTVGHLFTTLDFIILAATIVIPLAVGIFYGIVNKKTTEELLVGGRNMKIIPIAASLMATSISAATIFGFPSEVFANGIQILWMGLLPPFSFTISIYVFVPFFYPLKLTSIYEYLELRFDSVVVRLFASFTFILQQIVMAAVYLYASSLALEIFFGFSPLIAIGVLGITGTIYTAFGGLKAVVWTDTFQMLLMYGGMVTILIKSFIVAGGVTRAFEVAAEGGRLELFDLTLDPFMRHNLFNFVFGYGFTHLLGPGLNQHQVQRYSSMPTLTAAKRSLLLSVLLKVLAVVISIISGVAIFAAFRNCDPMLLGEIKKQDQLVPYFIMKYFGDTSGMLGLFTSAIFCAGLSSYSSSINGMVATTWKDFLMKLSICEKMDERNRTKISIIVGGIYGIVTMILACFAKYFGRILTASLTVTGSQIGAIGGGFVVGLFVPFVNKEGALGGMLIGLVSTSFITLQAFLNQVKPTPLGHTSTSECTIDSGNVTHFDPGNVQTGSNSVWPEKMYTLSYLMYPLFAFIVTVISSVIISLIFRAFSNQRVIVNPKYLHHYIRKKPVIIGICTEKENINPFNGRELHYQVRGRHSKRYSSETTPCFENIDLQDVKLINSA